jgi:drug/metabolite transporter (DMT)-like permease
MRLKLVLISSLIAAIAGAGSAIAIILSVFSSLHPTTPGLAMVATYLLPLLTTLLASVFVYRHTARRRKLQAFLTAIIALLLTILIFVAASIVMARREPVQPQPNSPANIS